MSDYPIIEEELSDGQGPRRPAGSAPSGPASTALWVSAGSAALGAVFAAVSTSDFIGHLDRQVHSIHCSFIPGAAAETGESGCRTVMMSPYSSLFRESLWGGLPISLLALAVFSYLVFRALTLVLRPGVSRRETIFLVAACALPVVMSVIYGFIAATRIGAVCKLCAGIYVSSALVFIAATAAHRSLPANPRFDPQPVPYARWFGEGVFFVFALSLLYVVAAPQNEKNLKGCGTLTRRDDPNGVFISLGSARTGTPAIAVLDPLCPSCRAFDQRLDASDLRERLQLSAVLFPLDSTCNWMVKETVHPGACAVSEAMLCDKDGAADILDFAFAHQEELRAEAAQDEGRLRHRLEKRFPKVAGCLGGSTIKQKLNKSLRWAVANALPVLTPQLFVGDKRVCDEDTDLGLDYTVYAMLSERGGGRRVR